MVKADVFVLGNSPEYSELNFNYTHRIPQTKITAHTFNLIKRIGSSKYFYVVKESAIADINFEHPVYEHENAFQFWNGDDSVRLYNKDIVMKSPTSYTDDQWTSGNITDVYNIVDDNIQVVDGSYSDAYAREHCQAVILTAGWPSWAEKISKLYWPIIHIDSNKLEQPEIDKILSETNKDIVYLIRNDIDCEGEFQVNWVPPVYDRKYYHVWNNNTDLAMIARSQLLTNPELYTDTAFREGTIPVKHKQDSSVAIAESSPDNDKTLYLKSRNQCAVFILTNGWPKWANALCRKFWPVVHINSHRLDFDAIEEILNKISYDHEYVYLLRDNVDTGNFNLDYMPQKQDDYYIHTWNDTFDIQMMSVKALKEAPEQYTDQALKLGLAKTKNHTNTQIKHNGEFDVFFISYHEPYADDNFSKLYELCPRVTHVKNIKGIFEAHKRAASLSTTQMFYVVDADAQVYNDFDFAYKPEYYDRNAVHVWRSKNPVNGLEYGYGGIKLFPTEQLRELTSWNTDFTTSVSNDFIAMDETSNITQFNTDPFSSWRSGFREACKLASGAIENDDESKERLYTWTHKAIKTADYAHETLQGAQHGAKYGKDNANDIQALACINDYEWLRNRFDTWLMTQ